jgi:hypothetical protein
MERSRLHRLPPGQIVLTVGWVDGGRLSGEIEAVTAINPTYSFPTGIKGMEGIKEKRTQGERTCDLFLKSPLSLFIFTGMKKSYKQGDCFVVEAPRNDIRINQGCLCSN